MIVTARPTSVLMDRILMPPQLLISIVNCVDFVCSPSREMQPNSSQLL
jgi:hypothetical protein